MYTRKWLEKTVLSHKQTLEIKLNYQPVCKYPGKIIPIKQKPGKTPDGTDLDTEHIHLMDAETKLAFAYATSAKKTKDGTPNIRISNEKLNGSITSIRDPKTNKCLKDENGNYIPHPVKGGQRIGLYKTPKKYEEADMFIIQKNFQPGCDKNEDTILKIVKESKILEKPLLVLKKNYKNINPTKSQETSLQQSCLDKKNVNSLTEVKEHLNTFKK